MNIFLRELTNRIISYLIRVSKGATYEEKQEQLLKKVLLFALMMAIMAATMTAKYIVTGWYMNDLERSVEKIDTFMGTQQENMNQLFRINTDQYGEIQKKNRTIKEMNDDIHKLMGDNAKLQEDNQALTDKLRKK
jgi:TolA-binding protein